MGNSNDSQPVLIGGKWGQSEPLKPGLSTDFSDLVDGDVDDNDDVVDVVDVDDCLQQLIKPCWSTNSDDLDQKISLSGF